MKILFVSAGRRTYLVEFAIELISKGYDLEVWVSDVDKNTASFYVSPVVNHWISPRVSDGEEEFVNRILDFCHDKSIDIVVPLMDFVIPALSKNKTRFDKNNIKLWVSEYDAVINCLDKLKSEAFCKSCDLLMPPGWVNKPTDHAVYPVIRKKIKGSGSVGQSILSAPSDEPDDFVADGFYYQQFVKGEEFALDVFNDYHGNYLHSCSRKKLLMRSGETDKAETINSNEFEPLAKKISASFRHIGNMDVDFIKDKDGNIFLLDFNPRFGGGYPFTHFSGANYVKAIVDLSLGKSAEFPNNLREIVGMKTMGMAYYEKPPKVL